MPSFPSFESTYQVAKELLHGHLAAVGLIKWALTPKNEISAWHDVALLPTARGFTTGPLKLNHLQFEIHVSIISNRVEIISRNVMVAREVLIGTMCPMDLVIWVNQYLERTRQQVDIYPYLQFVKPLEDILYSENNVSSFSVPHQILKSLIFAYNALNTFRKELTIESTFVGLLWHTFELSFLVTDQKPGPPLPTTIPSAANIVKWRCISHHFEVNPQWFGGEFYSFGSPSITLNPSTIQSDLPLMHWKIFKGNLYSVLNYVDLNQVPDAMHHAIRYLQSSYTIIGRALDKHSGN